MYIKPILKRFDTGTVMTTRMTAQIFLAEGEVRDRAVSEFTVEYEGRELDVKHPFIILELLDKHIIIGWDLIVKLKIRIPDLTLQDVADALSPYRLPHLEEVLKDIDWNVEVVPHPDQKQLKTRIEDLSRRVGKIWTQNRQITGRTS